MTEETTKKLKNSIILKLPYRHINTIILIAIASELLIMAALESLSIHNVYLDGYLDTILLLIILSTLLYFLIIKPMDRYIEQCRRAKEELFEVNEHYRVLIDSGEALICKLNSAGKCTFKNQTWLNYSGRQFEQQSEDGWMEEIHPDDLLHFQQELMLAFEQKEKFSIKYRILHVSGQYRWIQNNATPTFTSKGEFTGYLCHCLDIHDHKMIEDNISKREKEYRTIFEYSPIAAFFIDRKGTIIFWNKVAEKTFGWTKEETIGKSLTLFFKPDYSKPEINYQVEKVIDTYSNELITKEFYKNDGTIIVCEWHRTPIYDTNGKTEKVILVAKDITERKRYEQQLIDAKEKAEEMERLKSAFLANMSHELRSPLNSIIGFSELLSDPNYDEAQKAQFAKLIHSGGTNLFQTITELMDFSKIDAGQVKVNKKPVSLHTFLNELQLEYSFKAAEKGIDLVLNYDNPQHDIVINTDEIKLRQILVNFLTNALKFTTKGRIELGLMPTDNFVQLYVRDTGIGIPQEYQEKIFERFLQVESPSRRKYGGIGLGLAISKSLVELLGGNIWVESCESMGSTFYFTLPHTEDSNHSSIPAPEPIQRMHEKKNVMIKELSIQNLNSYK